MTTTFASSPKFFFTSESVTEGHPDKMCDQISRRRAWTRSSRTTRTPAWPARRFATTGLVVVMGEITTTTYVDIPTVVRDTVREIGYTRAKYGFDADTCGVMVCIKEQCPDIALGVDKALEAKHGEMSRCADRGHRRRRPGHDDRLRLQRDRELHAAVDRPGAQAVPAAGRRAQGRHPALPAPRRQEPGHGRVPLRQAGARRHGRHLHAAQPRCRPRQDRDGHVSTG